jgi:hypothetical protein
MRRSLIGVAAGAVAAFAFPAAAGAAPALHTAAGSDSAAITAASALAAGGNVGFGFNARHVSGISGAVTLTGGGAYNPDSAGSADPFVHSGGGFRCSDDVGGIGLLSGCLAGQGVRWDTADTAGLPSSTLFKCTAADPAKTAFTTDDSVVLAADFYRAGNGNDESFNAKMIVSDTDIDPDITGDQNVWIQGVGCGSATVNFST